MKLVLTFPLMTEDCTQHVTNESNSILDKLVDDWFDAFFGEENIVYTIQAMMRNLNSVGHKHNKSSNDLCALCITISNSKIVPALTNSGLAPFLNNYMYVILYKDMTSEQLKSLQKICMFMQKEKQNLFQPYNTDFYMLPIFVMEKKMDMALILYAAAVLLQKSLQHTRISENGDVYYEKLNTEHKKEYINSCLFKILHSGSLKRGLMPRVLTLLEKNKIIV